MSPDLQLLLDRAAIREAIESWGLYRDAGRWDDLRALYTRDGTMQTSWSDGRAVEFVERSIESAKAIAESRMVILLRASLQGADVDVACYARFYDRFVRMDGRWLIKSRMPIYEKDRLDPVNPANAPVLKQVELGRFPEGYRHLAYLQTSAARPATPNLHVANGESLSKLYAEGRAWLNEAR